LVDDAELIAKIDATVARHAPTWMRLTGPKTAERIDMWVTRFDPAGVRVPGMCTEDRYVEIAPANSGPAGVRAQLHATDGAALEPRLDALAATVCRDDPRIRAQRRADALGALAAGLDVLRCQCGNPDCPAAQRPAGPNVVIHVLAEESAVKRDSRAPGYPPGFGPLPPTMLRDLAGVAKTKPLLLPLAGPESGYRPSAAPAEFVRFRDLCCRFPGCDASTDVCDIDHTLPYPLGPTHPSNLKLLCRYYQAAWRAERLAAGDNDPPPF
jgi:Domain of unknown function (DUF222)